MFIILDYLYVYLAQKCVFLALKMVENASTLSQASQAAVTRYQVYLASLYYPP